jgi:hypothetical protein
MDIGNRPISLVGSRKNPKDRVTIFSIFPKQIDEFKITLFPSHYVIPAGSVEKPGFIHIGAASWWKEIFESNQIMEIIENAEDVARAIIGDYNNNLFGSSEDAHPGLFFVPEEIGVDDAKKKYTANFAEALRKQRNYYLKQVNFADQIWSKQQNPAMIGEPMRLAAQELGLDKEWASNYVQAAMSKCPACGVLRDTNFPVCAACNRVVDTEKYKKLGLVLAEK